MVLIFGGAYQGKLNYALQQFGLAEADVHFCKEADVAIPADKKIVHEIDRWILALLRADRGVGEAMERFLEGDQEKVVICNDISCGVVPVDPLLRKWREEVGRSLGLLARRSNQVIRLYCGIPTKLK